MTQHKLKILVVDDSSLMRLLIRDMLSEEPEFDIAETANNGKEALEKTLSLKPHVILLDLVMKDYDGLYAVKHIMKECPTPILILSSLGHVNPDAVVEALDAGAYDFVNKPQSVLSPKIREVKDELYHKVRLAARADVANLIQKSQQTNNNPHTFDDVLPYHALVVGASTGGTGTIEELLKKLPANMPVPIIIAQHMPHEFVHSFANRLNALVPFSISVAQQGQSVMPGHVYLAPGHTNLKLTRTTGNRVVMEFSQESYKEYNHPSVDCLLESAAEVYGRQVIGVLLTGMGRDGAQGLKKIYDSGGYTIAQDERSSVVFGMPKAAIDLGAARAVLSDREIPGFVVSCF